MEGRQNSLKQPTSSSLIKQLSCPKDCGKNCMLGADRKRLRRDARLPNASGRLKKRSGRSKWSEVRLVSEVKSSGRASRLMHEEMCSDCSWDKKETDSGRRCREMQF